ncbi:MAG: hypothetical protein ACLUVY_00745, partial [Bacteroides uniformis]
QHLFKTSIENSFFNMAFVFYHNQLSRRRQPIEIYLFRYKSRVAAWKVFYGDVMELPSRSKINILSLFGTATFYSQLCSFKSLFKNQLNKSFYYANEPIIRAIFPLF